MNKEEIAAIISVLDLTSLNADDSKTDIQQLCQAAQTSLGNVAAVCVYPDFLSTALKMLKNTNIKVATVINFPLGNDTQPQVMAAIEEAIYAGADEIDLVIPYRQCLLGQTQRALDLVSAVKAQCGKLLLKVILETGAFSDEELLAKLSYDVLIAGADFLKTSTGKIAVGARISDVKILLLAIVKFHQKTGVWRGLKVSGGVRDIAQAQEFMCLAEKFCGNDYTKANTFRIGASSLLNKLLDAIA